LADYLLPISDREPLAWIVAEQRTAVGANRRREAEALKPGDRILLYTTRGCFRNPTRDRARVESLARELADPVRFGEREYPVEVRLRIESLAMRGSGVELAPLVARLESFPNRRAWSAYLRRALVPLAREDGKLLAKLIRGVARPYDESAASYKTAA
jgi:hypothetical protein